MPREPGGQGSLTDFPPEIQAKLQHIDAVRGRYHRSSELRDLNEVVEAWEAILRNPDFPKLHEGLRGLLLNSAGEAYVHRSRRFQEIPDLDRGLALRRQAVLLMHRDWPEFPDFLSNLAKDFWDRYEQTHEARHLEEYGELVWQLPASHPNAFAYLNNLGIALGTRFHDEGVIADAEEAIRCFKEAVTRSPTPDSRSRALNNLTMTLWNLYHHTNDARDLEEYGQIVQQLPPTLAELPQHLNNLAKGLWTQFERTRDTRVFEDYRQVVQLLPASCPDLPGHLNNVGAGYVSLYETTRDIADLEEAIHNFERAIAGTPSQSLPLPQLRSWLDSPIGKHPSQQPALQVTDESLQNRRCRYLSNLGTALIDRYKHMGKSADLAEAIQTLEQSVEGSSKGSSGFAARLATLGDALRLLYERTRVPDDLDVAIQKYDLAVERNECGSPDFASILVSRGIGLVNRYDLAGKVCDLKSAVADFRTGVKNTPPDSSDRPAHLNSLGIGLSKLYQRLRDIADLDEAIRVFSEAVDVAKRRSSKNPSIPIYLNNSSSALAFRYERTHDVADLKMAIEYIKNVSAEVDLGSPILPSLLANLGSRLSSLYKETKSPADLQATIDTWEQGLRSLHTSYVTTSVSFKVGGERTWPGLYTNLVGAYLTQMDVEPTKAQSSLRRAIEVAEQSKSYLLAEQFGRADMPIPAGVSAEQTDREKQLLAELTRLDAMELAAYGQLEVKQHEAGGLQRLRQREHCRQELQHIWTLMEQSGPEAAGYVALRRGDALLWDDLVKLTAEVGTDTALLSLLTAPDNTVIFVLRKGQDPRWIDGKTTSATWNDVWSTLVDEVHNHRRTGGNEESWDRPLRSLLEKTYAELAPVKRVILSPHGLGHLIPWSAAISRLGLREPDESPLPVVTVPSLKLVTGFRPYSSGRMEGALVVGNPTGNLRFAENEARVVATKLGVQALVGRQAKKDVVLQSMVNASIVHLATHGFLSKVTPMDSGVKLADGVLTAREVMQRRLRTDLLVLSACETGLGASLGGDEVAGLARAFMYAGVRSMLVSLWKVDDMATEAFMTAFYDAYCNGANKAEALSQAMAKIRAEKRWQHSYYWGAFTLMGHWD